jgi:hypothetical protein
MTMPQESSAGAPAGPSVGEPQEGSGPVFLDRRAALGLVAGLGGWLIQEPATAGEGGVQAALHAEIAAVLDRTAAVWNSQHFYRLKDVWDGNDPEPWYVPEEVRTPFYSWPEIEKYWGPERRVLRAFRWGYDDLRVKSVAPDLALAIFNHYYELELALGKPPPPPTAGFDRCLTIFRRTAGGWRHVLYAQCPSGPELYVREMGKRVGTPEATALAKELEAGIRRLREQIVPADFRAYSDGVEASYRERHGAEAPAIPAPYRPQRAAPP